MRELTEYEDYIECALDEADVLAEQSAERMTHEEVFANLRMAVKASVSYVHKTPHPTLHPSH